MSDNKTKDTPHYLGHRKRLRERFLNSEPDTIPDYELLELLLFAAMPRSDTKPLAKELIKKFKGLGGVLSATPIELAKVKGVGEAVIVAIKAAQVCGVRLLRQEVLYKPVLSSWKNLLDYCHASMAYQRIEQVRLLFLNSKNQLIADEVQQTGTIDHAPIYAREVVKRALELHASAVIMVHNHPSGDPKPSKEDITMTKTVQKALSAVDIALHDHLIVGSEGHTSLKSAGII